MSMYTKYLYYSISDMIECIEKGEVDINQRLFDDRTILMDLIVSCQDYNGKRLDDFFYNNIDKIDIHLKDLVRGCTIFHYVSYYYPKTFIALLNLDSCGTIMRTPDNNGIIPLQINYGDVDMNYDLTKQTLRMIKNHLKKTSTLFGILYEELMVFNNKKQRIN